METTYNIDYNVYIFYVFLCVYQTKAICVKCLLYSLTGKELKIPTVEIIIKD